MVDETIFGPVVLLVRTTFDGGIVREWLPAALAVIAALYDADNGSEWYSARIVADDVAMRQWDVGG